MICQADLLLCSGTSGISQEIKKVTGSEYSHVGLIFVYEMAGQRTAFVIEAISDGVAVIPLEQYFTNYQNTGKPYPGRLFIGRFHGGLSMQQKRSVHHEAVMNIGKEYDNASILKQAFNYFFGTALEDKDNHRLICSELVALCYANAGISLKKDKHGYTTPASIARDERIVIARLKDIADTVFVCEQLEGAVIPDSERRVKYV